MAKPMATGTKVWLALELSAAALTTKSKKAVKIISMKKPCAGRTPLPRVLAAKQDWVA